MEGKKVPTTHGMGETQKIISQLEPHEYDRIRNFIKSMPNQVVLDGGYLVVAHAGCPKKFQGIVSDIATKECIFGTMLGTDENGIPIRDDWAARYQGKAVVVQGHIPVLHVEEKNNVWDIDTGCPFGGGLTALRYPTMELIFVPARKDYTNGHPTALKLAQEKELKHGF